MGRIQVRVPPHAAQGHVVAFQVRQEKEYLELVLSLDDVQQMDDVKDQIITNIKKEVTDVCTDKLIFSSDYSRRITTAGKEQFIFRSD